MMPQSRNPAAPEIPTVAEELAELLEVPHGELTRALSAADPSPIGRFRERLNEEQLADVEAEAGGLLRALGYLT